MAQSNEEALGGKKKVKAAMAHSRPGTTSDECEALGGMQKKMESPAHVGFNSTSNEHEALGGMQKKRGFADMTSPNSGAGDAAKHIK